MPTPPDEYTSDDLRRFLASAEARADSWRNHYKELLQKLARIADALYVGGVDQYGDDELLVRDDDHLRAVVNAEIDGLPEGWRND